ncbi:DM13 domain-containing protein [Candidatus Wolfebacteria bacterium]|nr:DM13 domain-containing protein [Candidatus Wolfebacteria bacterium]
MKKLLILIVLVLIAGFGYYAISPLFDVQEVDDALPEVASGVEKLTPVQKEEMDALIVEANKEPIVEMEEVMPEMISVSKAFPVMGTFGHPASGSVRVIKSSGETILRFEDFETINGPNLHLYLSKDLEAEDFIDLGAIRGTKGNINYTVPEGVDLSEYRYVMYWCVPFSVLFNYAEIYE